MNAPLTSYTNLPLNQPAVYYNADPSEALDRAALSRLELNPDEVKEDAEKLEIAFKVCNAAQRSFRRKAEVAEEAGHGNEDADTRLSDVLEMRRKEAKEESRQKRIRTQEKIENTPPITPVPIPAAAAPLPRPLPTTLEGDALLSTRFSQFSINSALENRQLLFPLSSRNEGPTLYDSFRREGWRRGASPITVVRMPDGLTSFDNRRLAVAHTIVREASHSLSIPVEAHEYTERATRDVLQRSKNVVQAFEDPARSIPADSYGEAIACRVAGSARLNGVTLTDTNRWGFKRLPAVCVGWNGRNKHEIIIDPATHSSHLAKK